MDNLLNYNALMAWTAFGMQDYSDLEKHGQEVYNYFVHKPTEILNLENPLLIGKIFQACLGFQEPDHEIQEVRAENAFICFYQALKSDNFEIHDEAAARLLILLIQWQKYLINKVEQACQVEGASPYSFFSMLNDGFPNDMPMATNTKMLYTAYFLYDCITNKSNIINEFVNPIERQIFERSRMHVLHHCSQITKTSQDRKAELGKMVYDKICNQLINDIRMYSNSL